MCRFLAYFGPSTSMENLLFKTSNSLVKQSRHAKLRHEPINGDGFGLGWYTKNPQGCTDNEPGTFVSIEPAWSNRNLRQLSHKVCSHHFFAHVRDASPGMPVSQSNCHPFQSHQYLWMHNGHLDQFSLMRRALLNELSDKSFDFIKGNTDSEHAFGICLDQLRGRSKEHSKDLKSALLNTIKQILDLRNRLNLESNAQMNFALSNGQSAVFSRFSSNEGVEPPSLFYLQGACSITKQKTVIVASEPITDDSDWQKVKRNQLLCVHSTGELELTDIAANLSGVPTSIHSP